MWTKSTIYSIIILCILEINIAIDAEYLQHPYGHAPKSRIIGGKVVPYNKAPFMVAITVHYNYSEESEVELCGGTVLSDRYVLTAAHCLYGTDRNEVKFGVQNLDGSDSKPGNPQIRYNESFVLHDSYAPPFSIEDDIAIITLSKPIVVDGQFVKAVKLPPAQESLDHYNTKTASTYGWGFTHDPPPKPETVNELRYVNVSVISNDECKESWGREITDKYICTSNHGKKGVCSGDTGGPLILDEVQIGITSFDLLECEEEKSSVYIRVDRYLDWIRKTTK